LDLLVSRVAVLDRLTDGTNASWSHPLDVRGTTYITGPTARALLIASDGWQNQQTVVDDVDHTLDEPGEKLNKMIKFLYPTFVYPTCV